MLISDSLVTVFSFYKITSLQNDIIGDSKDQIAHAII